MWETVFLHWLLFNLKKRRSKVEKKELCDNKDILLDIVKDIRYGSVTVHIQDGKIVYVEKTEKIKVRKEGMDL